MLTFGEMKDITELLKSFLQLSCSSEIKTEAVLGLAAKLLHPRWECLGSSSSPILSSCPVPANEHAERQQVMARH